MKGKKILLLSLALILPVFIFIFLKIFGRNEFQVPVMHQESTIAPSADCDFQYATPYRVPDSVFTTAGLTGKDSLYVFYFDPVLNTAMKRVSVEFAGAPVKVVSPDAFPRKDHRFLRECLLLMTQGTSVALADHKHRIRGYYNGTDLEEVDRLIVEIKIILKKY